MQHTRRPPRRADCNHARKATCRAKRSSVRPGGPARTATEGMMATVRDIRQKLLALGHVSQAQGYECVLIQGEQLWQMDAA